METNDILSFLKCTVSQEEASLLIAQDEKEASAFEKEMKKYKFAKAKDVFDLTKKVEERGRYYVKLDSAISKDLYDFLVQYPTRQIQIFHPGKMKSCVVTPIYEGVSVVFVATKNAISNSEKGGLSFLGNVGMTYQS